MQQIPIDLGNTFPVVLVFLENGTIALALKTANSNNPFQPPQVQPFNAIHDLGNPVAAYITMQEFIVYNPESEETYTYNQMIQYKDKPLLLSWLQQQNLIFPF